MSEQVIEGAGDELKALADTGADFKVAPAHGIAAMALSFALKYHDINHVHDGALYQQYKLEGRNIAPLHLDWVFETAMRIERHLLASSDRIASIVVDALATPIEDDTEVPAAEENAAEDAQSSNERGDSEP